MAHPNVHLITGLTGAGKSTYSERLAQDVRGVRFSIDEWMQTLHNMDQPAEMSFDWFYDRVQRNCQQMRNVAEQVIKTGAPVVFDCGFTNRAERTTFADWADAKGYKARLHFIDIPDDVRWSRVEQRNRKQAETFQFEVTRYMFDFINSIWEGPEADEMVRMDGVVINLADQKKQA